MNNWYHEAKNNLVKEAGIKENLLMGALTAFLMGTNITDAAEKYNVPVNELQHEINKNEQNKTKSLPKPKGLITKKENSPQGTIEQVKMNNTNAVNIVARTLYKEGRSETTKGLQAIATVICNRGNNNVQGVISAIKRKNQFSCWNKATEKDFQTIVEYNDEKWEECKRLAQSIISGTFTPIGTWTHYYNPKICNPKWAYIEGKLRPHEDIGNHRFMDI